MLEMVGMGFANPHQMKIIQFVKTAEDVIPAIREQKRILDEEKECAQKRKKRCRKR